MSSRRSTMPPARSDSYQFAYNNVDPRYSGDYYGYEQPIASTSASVGPDPRALQEAAEIKAAAKRERNAKASRDSYGRKKETTAMLELELARLQKRNEEMEAEKRAKMQRLRVVKRDNERLEREVRAIKMSYYERYGPEEGERLWRQVAGDLVI
ncbi:hypothetical protein DL93DRAFT_2164319 [Clavulina sp. PMI_390]|nr:hypothetical protein DL93DRAFT_2164319 [Clavulina sp. PMI_390]